MKKKALWLFEEWNGGGKALFETEQEAINFRKKLDIDSLEEYGVPMGDDEYTISKVYINPDFEKWWTTHEYDD